MTTAELSRIATAPCHPSRELWASNMCRPCYDHHGRAGTLPPTQPRPAPEERTPTCHPDRTIWARGLCKPCYDHHDYAGTLDQFPTKSDYRCRADFVADYELLRSEGYTHAQMAERLGMKRRTFYAALSRATRAGDITTDRRRAAA